MVRTEIYANRSVEEDIHEEIEKRFPGFRYSLFEDVQGRGRNGVRHGTAIWPELNILYVIYGSEAEARLVGAAVAEVKKAFPREGIKIFQYEVKTFPGEGSDAARSQL
ncbi:MAG: hypothetical protein CVV53_02885 [Spirochaetae bacterium HGW-Spirochaetae-9]|nr:MAG: hypothetical protein CVV53_02885 [Spirochaetae bacterium HGW-Spirochaetae-9]